MVSDDDEDDDDDAFDCGTDIIAEFGVRCALLMVIGSGDATVSVTPSITAVFSMTDAACCCAAPAAICTGLVAATEAPTAKGE